MFVDKVRVASNPGGYLSTLAVVRSLIDAPVQLTSPITIFTGDNGAGKSTLIEAIAVAVGANPEGGSRNARFSTVATSVSSLWRHLVITRSLNPKDVYFLRGETYAQLADYHASLALDPLAHITRLSHGQGLMHIFRERCGPDSLLILDEPEDGLSMFAQLELLGIMYHLAATGAQIIMSTHSPVLLGIPGANLREVGPEGITSVVFDETESVRAWEEFITDPVGTAQFMVQP
ncbi:AAA family ATPase [Corynebacterium lipophiloflavum]|nr:AAA family ATPase [Corynebacterium lipophiloflavum]